MAPFDLRLLRAVPRSRGPVAFLAVLSAAQGLVAIAQAFALAGLVVAVAAPGATGHADLGSAGTAVVITFALRGLLGALVETIAARTGAVVSGELRASYTRALLRRPAEERPDQALSMATQGASAVEPYVARYLPTLVAALVLPVATMVTMAWLDWPTALVPLLTVPLLPLFAALIGATTGEATARRWRTLAQLSGHFLDVMRGLPTLAAYGRARRQGETIRRVSNDHRIATVGTLKLAFVSSAALELLATLSVAIVAVSVGIRLANGSLPLAIAMPLILLAPEAYWPIRRVGAEFHNAADGAVALRDLLDVIDHARSGPPDLDGANGADGPGLMSRGTVPHPGAVLRDVQYQYDEAAPRLLGGLSATLPDRGLVVVTGPSGAGKTTLLFLLAGLRTPTTGVVSAARTHLVTQRPYLAPFTLRENLLLGGGDRVPSDAELVAALGRVGLDPLLAALPGGLATPLGDDGFGLSAGQRARVALARALLSPAPVLLLDEPTAHLDPAMSALVHEVIADDASRRLVVAVTHRPELVEIAALELPVSRPDLATPGFLVAGGRVPALPADGTVAR